MQHCVYIILTVCTIFQVYLDDILCGTIRYEMGINPYVISCDARVVKKITVVGGSQDGVLTL